MYLDCDEEMCEEERLLMSEINGLKNQLEEARKNVRDTDFVKVTEDICELGRLKYKIRRHLRGHLAKVNDLHWASDSESVVTASQDGKLIVWDSLSGNKLHMIPLKTAWVIGCAYSPNSDLIASGGLDNLCSVFQVNSRETPDKPRLELSGHDGYISSCRFIDSGKLITGSGDKTLALWDLERCKLLDQMRGHSNDVTRIELSSDRNIIVSVSTDRTARLWDLRISPRNTVQLFEGHTQDINGVAFLPIDTQGFITASDDHTCRLWDLRADQPVATYIDEYIHCGSTCCSISKSGRLLFAGYDDYNCHVWDVLREERVGIMPVHEDRLSCVQVSPNGMAVATAAWDSNCHIWTAK